MASFIASSAVVLAGGSLWYLFKRSAPILTTDELPPNIPDNVEVVSQLTEEERTAVKAAFLSGDDFRWLVGGKDFKTELNEKNHVNATFYLMECVLHFAERYGHMIVCRDDDGTFLGALGLIPPYQSSLLFMLHFFRSALPLGMPVPMQMGKDVGARFDAFNETISQHKQLMKGTPHFYVQILGVSSQAQGKGAGRKLMNAAIAIAGAEKTTPLYLECHDGNVAFYEKLGYKLKSRYFLVPKGIEDTSTFPYNGMVYGRGDAD